MPAKENNVFKLKAPYPPAGDQPQAIEKLVEGLKKDERFLTLLGVTGSGKTFTMANVIAEIGKPTLVIAHNKTLAAQLAQEYKTFFPDAAVHYFVSYYDFYQPEAYMPVTDTYIEKEAQVNEEIDRLRHAATQALLTRKDVIIVASVSCIYGLGSPAEYEEVNMRLSKGDPFDRAALIRKLVNIHFERTNADLSPGMFRGVGKNLEIMPVSERVIYRIEESNGKIEAIVKIDPVSRKVEGDLDHVFVFPAKHFITDKEANERALKTIKEELDERLTVLERQGKVLEYERLKRRTSYDLAMIKEIGYCSGIENYSRHFSGKSPGEPPDTLLSYFPSTTLGTGPKAKKVPDFLTVIDESHVTVSQIGGMRAGDRSRKDTLVEHGFRLPSAVDNRPLSFEEFEERVGQVVFTSATPADYERKNSSRIVEQIIRPTGLVDPEVVIKPVVESKDKTYPGQIQDFIKEAEVVVKRGERAMATTLTKRMAEDLANYLIEKKIKTAYLHSDVETLDRITILTDLRKGKYDILVGVNLLREGLDLPEVSFIGILDADKEGFLRSETSLIQTIGRAARNVNGRVVLYADSITGSMQKAIDETNRRRAIQIAYNKEHGITPKSVTKAIHDITESIERDREKTIASMTKLDKALYGEDLEKLVEEKRAQMEAAVETLDFETAAIIRDEIRALTGEKTARAKPRKRR